MRVIVWVVSWICMLVVGASAQAGPQLRVFVDGALGVPTNPGEFVDGWDQVGVGGGGGLAVILSPILTITGSFDYMRVGLNEEGFIEASGGQFPADAELDGGATQIIYISGGVKANLLEEQASSGVMPYALAGVGYYRRKLSSLEASAPGGSATFPTQTENVIGFNVGVGVDLEVNRAVNIFFEGRYVIGFTDGDSTGHVPLRAGVSFLIGQQGHP